MNQKFTTSQYTSERHNEEIMVTPSAHAYASVVEGKAIVLNLESGRYYSLNRMATNLWEQLSSSCSLHSLLHSLSTQGGISQERAHLDLSSFLENLDSEGLIQQTRRT